MLKCCISNVAWYCLNSVYQCLYAYQSACVTSTCCCTCVVLNKTKQEGGSSLRPLRVILNEEIFFENALQKWQWQQPETFKNISWPYTFILYIPSGFLYQLNQQILFSHPKRVEWSVCCCQYSTLSLPDSETFGLNGSNEVRLCWMRYLELWLLERKKKTCLSTRNNLWRSATSLVLGLEGKTISLNVFLLISVTLLSCGSLKAVRGPSKVRERTEQCPV